MPSFSIYNREITCRFLVFYRLACLLAARDLVLQLNTDRLQRLTFSCVFTVFKGGDQDYRQDTAQSEQLAKGELALRIVVGK